MTLNVKDDLFVLDRRFKECLEIVVEWKVSSHPKEVKEREERKS